MLRPERIVVVYTVVKEGFRDEGTFQQRTGRSELCRNLRQQQIKRTKVGLCLAWSRNS